MLIQCVFDAFLCYRRQNTRHWFQNIHPDYERANAQRRRIRGNSEDFFFEIKCSEIKTNFQIFQLRKKILEKAKDGTLQQSRNGDSYKTVEPRKRGRWDQTIDEQFVPAKKTAAEAATPTWGDVEVSVHYITLTLLC